MKRSFFLMFLLFLAACSNTPNPEPTPGDLAVSISSPSGTVYTNGSINVQVVVSGGTPDTVELLKNEQVLVGNLTAPYTYTWDTRSEAEGSYNLTAKATQGSKVFTSSTAVTVTVDRTAPTITERTPAPGAENVLYSAAIRVVFSEPIMPSTVTSSNVQLVANNLPVPFTSSLTSDGLTLTLQAAKDGISAFDTQSTLSLSGLTDLAGNELLSSEWSWTLPTWLTVGETQINDLEDAEIISLRSDSLELDGLGHPVVIVNEINSIGGKGVLYVKRWTGTEWQRMGENLMEGSGTFTSPNALTLDASGNPVVAFSDANRHVNVQRWDGSSWQHIGSGSLNQNPERSAYPMSLSADASGNPVLAFTETTNTLRPLKTQLYVKRWTGSSWQLIGTGSLNQNADHYASNASLALDTSGRPVVAWDEGDEEAYNSHSVHVKRWTGTDWELVGGGTVNTLQFGFGPSLALDVSDQPVVAYIEKSDFASSGYLHVKRFEGTTWEDVGSSVRPISEYTENVTNVSLALDQLARPVIRYLVSPGTSSDYDTHFKRFNGSSWQPVAKPIESAYSTALALDEGGNPFTAAIRTKTNPVLSSAFVLGANH